MPRTKETADDLTSEQIYQRNKLVERYMPLIRSTAIEMDDPDETHYTKDELISAAYEGATISATKHIRKGSYDDKTFPTYLKRGVQLAVDKFKEREAETFNRSNGAVMVGLEELDGSDWDIDTRTPETICLEQEHEQLKVDLYNTIVEQFSRLKPKHAAVLQLIFIDNCTQEEVAEVLGVSQQAVSKMLGRAVVALKAQCEENGVGMDSLLR